MKNKPNVIIGIGCQSEVKSPTAHSIACAIIGAKGVVSDVLMRQGGDIVSARSWLVQEAINKGATHLLFVDSDMQFPPNTIPKLLAHKKEIVGVEYFKRKLPLEPVFKVLEPPSKTKIYKAGYVGTGLLLIDLSIFSENQKPLPLAKPYFNFGRNNKGEVVIGEDVWFCNTARDAGLEVWIDPTIVVGHIGDYTFK